MIDELEPAFEERSEKGRHRRGWRNKKNKKGGGRGKTIAAFLIVFALLGGLGGGAWYGFDRVQGYFTTPDYDGSGTGEVVIEVKQGEFLADIANTLYEAGVVKSAKAFTNAAADNPKAQSIQPGFYRLRKEMSGETALGLLLDVKSRVSIKVTVPEGMITLDIFAKLAEASKRPVKEFEEAAKDREGLGIADFWFKRDDGKKVATNLEGFLYPATYEFPPNATPKQMLQAMVEKFNEEMKRLDFVDKVQANLGITPYEALIAASIAQAEAVLDKDMGPVARVLYNRAYKGTFFCQGGVVNCLDLDSSINYWLRLQGKDPKASENITQSDLNNKKNPYNTHVAAGMPLGPISNPGETALKGAMEPPKNNNLFFVTIDKKGSMGYATTSDGHDRNVQLACKNGIPIC